MSNSKVKNKLDYIKKVGRGAAEELCAHAGLLWRASMVLFGLSLLAYSQLAPVLLESEFQDRRLQYEFDQYSQKRISDIEDCDKAEVKDSYNLAKPELVKRCRLANYKRSATQSLLGALVEFTKCAMMLGGILLILSCVGYFERFERKHLKGSESG
ncbi:hypothetical protein C84B14_07515 [Salinisphaera sp. C84B14]|uniref:hypothetical protein n=1 Tax=Salinisphaera sp. C84B14 TaxID=1304155 RepID=UPI003340C689